MSISTLARLHNHHKKGHTGERSGHDWCPSVEVLILACRDAVGNAVYTYRDHHASFEALAKRGMSQDLSWDNAAEQYEEALLAAKYQW